MFWGFVCVICVLCVVVVWGGALLVDNVCLEQNGRCNRYTYTIVYIYYIYSDPQYCNKPSFIRTLLNYETLEHNHEKSNIIVPVGEIMHVLIDML